jgi:uncharacterized protein (TIGR02118 family)
MQTHKDPVMIKVTILLRRNPKFTREAFVAYHRADHAALFTSLPVVKQTVRRYVQQHALDIEIPGLPAPKYDGITELWFDDVESFGRCFSDAEYMRVVRPDEQKLFDLAAAEIIITDETVVVA